jgi:hypothetical protein
LSVVGLDWLSLDWLSLDWLSLDWLSLDWPGLDGLGLDGLGLDRLRLDRLGLDWLGLGWLGLGWLGALVCLLYLLLAALELFGFDSFERLRHSDGVLARLDLLTLLERPFESIDLAHRLPVLEGVGPHVALVSEFTGDKALLEHAKGKGPLALAVDRVMPRNAARVDRRRRWRLWRQRRVPGCMIDGSGLLANSDDVATLLTSHLEHFAANLLVGNAVLGVATVTIKFHTVCAPRTGHAENLR